MLFKKYSCFLFLFIITLVGARTGDKGLPNHDCVDCDFNIILEEIIFKALEYLMLAY